MAVRNAVPTSPGRADGASQSIKGGSEADAAALAHYQNGAYYARRYRHLTADRRFYVALCRQIGGPVLELGCGTGRISRALAAAGLDVVGIDFATPMLVEARSKQQAARLPGRLEYRQGDIRTLRLRRRFPTVIAPFNVFMHLETPDAMQAALATVRAHLAHGGAFLFDVLMPPVAQLTFHSGKVLRGRACLSPGGQMLAYEEAFSYDPLTQLQLIEARFVEPTSRLVRETLTLQHRIWFPQELAFHFAAARFVTQGAFGAFDGAPLHAESSHQIYLLAPARAAPGSPR